MLLERLSSTDHSAHNFLHTACLKSLLNHTLLLISVDRLQFKKCHHLMVSKEMLSHCSHLFRGMFRGMLYFMSLFSWLDPISSLSLDSKIQMRMSSCVAEIHSASLLLTYWQACAKTRMGERGAAAYQSRLLWHDRMYQETAQLKRSPLPLQICHQAKSLGRGGIFAMQLL